MTFKSLLLVLSIIFFLYHTTSVSYLIKIDFPLREVKVSLQPEVNNSFHSLSPCIFFQEVLAFVLKNIQSSLWHLLQ